MPGDSRTLQITINVNSATAFNNLTKLRTTLQSLATLGTEAGLQKVVDNLNALGVSATNAAAKVSAAERTIAESIAAGGASAEASATAMSRLLSAMNALSEQKVGTAATAASEALDREATAAKRAADMIDALNAANKSQNVASLVDPGKIAALQQQAATRAGITAQQGVLSGVVQQGNQVASTYEVVQAAQARLDSVTQQVNAHFAEQQGRFDAARRSAYSLTISGYELVTVGERIANIFGGSIKTFEDFDFNLRRAAGSLEIFGGTSNSQFNALSEDMQKLAEQTKLFPAADLAKDMYYWASTTGQVVDAQTSLKDIESQLVPVIQAAAMTDTDQQTAIKGVVGILQEYGLGIDQAADVTQKLFYAAQKTSTEFPDLIDSFKLVGPVAAQNNLTFDETVRVLGSLADAGIRGGTAGRAFRQEFRQLLTPTAAANTALNDMLQNTLHLNTTWKDFIFPNGKFVGMEQIITSLAQSMGQMNDQQKSYLLKVISTAAEMPALTQEIQAQSDALQHGRSIFDDSATFQLSNAATVFTENWKQMGDSARATFEELKQHLVPVLLDIGQDLVQALKPVVAAIENIADAVHAFAQANPTVFEFGVKIAAAGAAGMILFGTLLLLIGGIKLLFQSALPGAILGHQKAATMALQQAAAIDNLTIATQLYNAELAKMQLMQAGSTAEIMVVSSGPSAALASSGASAESQSLFSIQGLISNTKSMWGDLATYIKSTPILVMVGDISSALVDLGFVIIKVISGFMAIVAAIAFVVGIFQGLVQNIHISQDVFDSLGKIIDNATQFFIAFFGIVEKIGQIVGTVLAGAINALVNGPLSGLLKIVANLTTPILTALAVMLGVTVVGTLADAAIKFTEAGIEAVGFGVKSGIAAAAVVAASLTEVGAIATIALAFDSLKASAIAGWLATLGPVALAIGAGAAFIALYNNIVNTANATTAAAVAAGDLNGAQAKLNKSADDYDIKLKNIKDQQYQQAYAAAAAAGASNQAADAAGKLAVALDKGTAAVAVATTNHRAFGNVIDAITGTIDKSLAAYIMFAKLIGEQIPAGVGALATGFASASAELNQIVRDTDAVSAAFDAYIAAAAAVDKATATTTDSLKKESDAWNAFQDAVTKRNSAAKSSSQALHADDTAKNLAKFGESTGSGLSAALVHGFIAGFASDGPKIVDVISKVINPAIAKQVTNWNIDMKAGIDGLVDAISEKGSKAKDAMSHLVQIVVDEAGSGKMKLDAIGQGLATFVSDGMKSKEGETRKAALVLAEAFAQEYKAGGTNKLLPVAAGLLNTIQGEWAKGTPVAHKYANEWLTSMAEAIQSNSKPGDSTYAFMGKILGTLADGTPKAYTAGFNMMKSWITGIIKLMPNLVTIMSSINTFKAALGAGTSGDIGSGTMGIKSGLKSLQDQYSAAFKSEYDKFLSGLPKFKVPSLDLSGGSSGGGSKGSGSKGGGSSADQKSPLEQALTVAQNAASLAEALQKIAGLNIEDMVKQSMGKIAKAMLLADEITLSITKGFGKSKLQAVADFSDATGKVATMLGNAADLFSKMGDFKSVPRQKIQKLVDDVYWAEKYVEDISDRFKIKALVAASVFADEATKVVGLIGAAYDAFSKIGEFKPISKSVFNAIALDIAEATQSIAKASTLVSPKAVKLAGDFSDGATKSVSLIGAAYDAFSKITDYKGVAKTVFNDLATDISTAVKAIYDASRISATMAKPAGDFADNATKSVSLVSAAFDAFSKIAADTKLDTLTQDFINAIQTNISDAVVAVSNASKTAAGPLANAAGVFADDAGKSVSLIGSAFDAFSKITDFKPIPEDTLANIADSIVAAVDQLNRKSSVLGLKADELTAVGGFADAANKVMSAVKAAMDLFVGGEVMKALSPDEERVFPQLDQLFGHIEDTMNHAKELAGKFKPEDITNIGLMADAASKVSSAISGFLSLTKDTGNDTGQTMQVMQQFSGVINGELDVIFNAMKKFADNFTTLGSTFMQNLITGINSQDAALTAAVAGINKILAGVGGTSSVNFSVATTANPLEIHHTVDLVNAPAGMTAQQVADILNSQSSAQTTAIAKAASTQ